MRYSAERLAPAAAMLNRWTADDRCPAAGAAVGSSSGVEAAWTAGRLTVAPGGAAAGDDTIFLIASPTKPVTALAAMLLIERGLVKLADRISDFVPDFAANGKRPITIAHCLTHTSGLPDMPPDNSELRVRQAPLEDFLASGCAVAPDFDAAHDVQYQSLGLLMIAEVVHQVTGRRIGEFLRTEIFEPLAMRDTALGMSADWERSEAAGRSPRRERIAQVRIGDPADAHSAVWNSDYWWRLGVPWGGLLSTPADLGKLCAHLLSIHAGGGGILRPASLAAMTTNQLERMPNLPEAKRRCQPWGLGWRLNWPHDSTSFGDLLSPSAYGHWGATGTLVWIDPASDAFAVVLTTEPLDNSGRFLPHFSNAVCSALAIP